MDLFPKTEPLFVFLKISLVNFGNFTLTIVLKLNYRTGKAKGKIFLLIRSLKMPQKSLSCLQQATFLFVCTKLKSFDCFDFYAIEEKIVQMHIDVLNISKRG